MADTEPDIEVQTIRHPVGADGTMRYRFTFHVSISHELATNHPAELGRRFVDELLDSLRGAVRESLPKIGPAARHLVTPQRPCPNNLHALVCGCPGVNRGG